MAPVGMLSVFGFIRDECPDAFRVGGPGPRLGLNPFGRVLSPLAMQLGWLMIADPRFAGDDHFQAVGSQGRIRAALTRRRICDSVQSGECNR